MKKINRSQTKKHLFKGHPIDRVFDLNGQKTVWKKVRQLKPGMKIAIEASSDGGPQELLRGVPGKKIEWDEIISIKPVGQEKVYDIEVENTHNFVGNGIIAHNTYISSNLGVGETNASYALNVSTNANIGTTLTTADLNITGAILDNGATGTSGYILSSTGSGIDWIANSGGGTTNTYTAGVGLTLSGFEFQHLDTSSQSASDNSNGVVIQDIDLDTFGHLTSLATVDLDNRFLQIGSTGSFITTLNEGYAIDITGSGVGRTIAFDATEVVGATTWGAGSAQTWTFDTGATDPYLYIEDEVFAFQNGRVGIGTTAPGYKLEVTGTGYFSDNVLIASGKQVQFADSGEYITSDGTDITIASGADLLFSNPPSAASTIIDIDHDANNLDEYDSTTTDSGDLSTGTPGLASTTARMEALIDDTTAIYGDANQTDPGTNNFRLRFYFDPNSITIGTGERFRIMSLSCSQDPWGIFSIDLRDNSGNYNLGLIWSDDSGWIADDWGGTLSDGPHYIEIAITKASTDSAADGVLEWWIDGVSEGQQTSVDIYDSFAILNRLRVGVISGVDAGTSGTIFFDEILANNDGLEIGPVSSSIQTKMIIQASGDVGIGTATPGYKLEVNGSGLFTTLGVGATSTSYDFYVSNSVGVGKTLTTTSLNLTSTAIGGSSVAAYLSGNSGLVGYLDTTAWDKSAADDYSAWILNADGGTPQSVGTGNTALFVGGDGIGTTVSATNTLTIVNTGVLSVTGTANQVIASNSTGDITLSLPQNIHTSATPTFGGLIVTTSGIGVTGNSVFTDNITAQKYIDISNDKYYLDPANSGLTTSSLALTNSGSIHFNAYYDSAWKRIVSSSAAKIQNFANGLMIGVGSSAGIGTTISDWESQSLFIDTSGQVGIGTTGPSQELNVIGDILITGGGAFGDGAAISTDRLLDIDGTLTPSTNSYGVVSSPSVGATTGIHAAVYARADTDDVSFTASNVSAFYAANPTKGASSTITNAYGLYIADITSGSSNWGIYSDTDADNYFKGSVGIGTAGPGYTLDVRGELYSQTGSGTAKVYFGNTATFIERTGSNTIFQSDNRDILLKTIDSTEDIIFQGNSTEIMRVDSGTGNIVITGNLDISTRLNADPVHSLPDYLGKVPNWSFETNVDSDTNDPDQWSTGISGTGSAGRSTADKNHGEASLILTSSSGTTSDNIYATSSCYPIQPSTEYRYSVDVKSTVANKGFVWRVFYYQNSTCGVGDSASTYNHEITGSFTNDTTTSWTTLTGTKTSPSNGYWAKLKVHNYHVANTSYYIDRVLMTPTISSGLSVAGSGYEVEGTSGDLDIYASDGDYNATKANDTSKWYWNNTSANKMSLDNNGALVTASTMTAAGSPDIAENIDTPINAVAGDLLSTNPNKTESTILSSKPYDSTLIGIISTKPGMLLNASLDSQLKPITSNNNQPLVLAGRIPTKVSDINGDIKIGDPITSSQIPGTGMKATKAGSIIARALQNFSTAEKYPCPSPHQNLQCAKILTFVTASWYDPDIYLTDTGGIKIIGSDNNYTLEDKSQNPITRIGTFAKIIAAKIKTGLLTATNIITETITSKTSISENLKTNLISPLSDLDSSITIDADTKITGSTVLNQVTATTLQTGIIDTDLLQAQDIQTTSIRAQNITTDNLETKDATVTGTLYANQIISNHGSFTEIMADKISSLRSEIRKLINETPLDDEGYPTGASNGDITGSSLLAQASEWTTLLATDSARIEGDLSIGHNLIIAGQLLIEGQTRLADTFVTGTLTVGQIAIRDNYIETTADALYIQPSGLGSIHLLSDTMIISDTGSVTINGNLIVNGSLTASTGQFNSLTSQDFNTQTATVSGSLFANLLDTINASISGTLVANQIKTNAINVATASATIIAESGPTPLDDEGYPTGAQIASNATAGTVTLPQGKTEITVFTDHISTNSMVYLTPAGSTQNQVAYVKNKFVSPTPTPAGDTPTSYFTIALDQSLNNDLDINWWIIN